MKKVYETPKAVKYVFNYQENVVASNSQWENVKNYPNLNPCYTHNTSNLNPPGNTCMPNANPK